MSKLILASKSPYRKQLLEKLNLDFLCVDSNFDETPLKNEIHDFIELSQRLSFEKANAVLENYPDAIIIGSDQVCCIDDKRLSKAGSKEQAVNQLSLMQGRSHFLHTSYCILSRHKKVTKTITTELKMKELSQSQIERYVKKDNPVDCAGSYKLEQSGISLMQEISTSDYTAIIGLPLMSLSMDLEQFGIKTP